MSDKKMFTGTNNYIASQELREIVNVAVQLERPLLIRGEPGTGKTLLAKAVAESLGMPLKNYEVITAKIIKNSFSRPKNYLTVNRCYKFNTN